MSFRTGNSLVPPRWGQQTKDLGRYKEPVTATPDLDVFHSAHLLILGIPKKGVCQ
jgi:hypothetical protein